jgi:NitT/TauT family transport system ATP-binding protein
VGEKGIPLVAAIKKIKTKKRQADCDMNDIFVVRLEDVYQRYHRDGKLATILNDIDLKVRPKEFVTVVGPSGCGKSTLLRLIVGWERAKSGTVRIDGVTAGPPNRDRGIVFQKYSLFPHLTVLENVLFGLELEQIPFLWKYLWYPGYLHRRKAWIREAMTFLERMRLSEHANKYPDELSGGMQQRVAIAQALIMKPKIILMDEPFGALDPGTREDMQVFLLELWEQYEMTIFFVTHDLEEALFLGTRIIVLSPYYTVDRGEAEGAKIVMDRKLPGPAATRVKYSPEFNVLLEEVKQRGFVKDYKQHISQFDLSHPDSWKDV